MLFLLCVSIQVRTVFSGISRRSGRITVECVDYTHSRSFCPLGADVIFVVLVALETWPTSLGSAVFNDHAVDAAIYEHADVVLQIV